LAAVNGPCFGDLRRFQVDNRVIPRTTFCDCPEVASVGLTGNRRRRARLRRLEVTRFSLAGNSIGHH